MGWIGLSSATEGWREFEAGEPTPGLRDRVLGQGTILLESQLSTNRRPQSLLDVRRWTPRTGHLRLQAVPGGGIVLIDALGDDIRHATLLHKMQARLDTVRLSYCWNADEAWARLTLEDVASQICDTIPVAAPVPLSLTDLREALVSQTDSDGPDDASFTAVSERIEPVGPMPTLTGQVPILTVRGEIPIRDIRRGDLVITDEGREVPVLHVVARRVPALGGFRPIRLRAPYFKLTRDIIVAPAQRLVMKGSQVEYMFGREAVLVPARHVLNHRSAFYTKGPALVTYFQLVLPGHETILAAGSPVESLYLGRMRRKPDVIGRSVLAGLDRSRLPEHAKPVWPVLKPFEAVTLATLRAA